MGFRNEKQRASRISFDCSDSTSVADDKIDALVNFPNRINRFITRIYIRSTYGNKLQFRLTIDDYPSFYYTIEGDDEEVLYIGGRLKGIIAGVSVAYSGFILKSPRQKRVLLSVRSLLGLQSAV